jgi:acyl-CoA thioester hydrolase
VAGTGGSGSRYPHWTSVPTRWKDNDVYGHVNSVVHYSVMDTVINTWLIERGGLDIERGEVIGLCVESHCAYHASVSFPDVLAVGLRVAHLGRSSVRYEIGIHRAVEGGEPGDAVADGHFVHVFVDRTTRRPVHVAGTLREALASLARP